MNNKQEKRKQQLLLGARLAILAGLVTGIWYIGDHLNWIRGESIPITLAWISPGPIRSGDYVLFDAQSPVINHGEKVKLTKQVVCVEGQRIDFDGETFFCDSRALGGVTRATSDGQAVPVTEFTGVIPAGKVFVRGSHPRSFDSRHLGLLDTAQLTRVEPIL